MADRSGRTRRKQAAPPRGAGKAADTGDALRRAPVRDTYCAMHRGVILDSHE